MTKLIKYYFLLAVCQIVTSLAVFDVNADDHRVYIAANGGVAKLNLGLDSSYSSGDFGSSSTVYTNVDDSLITKRLTLGYQFHKYYGIELSLTDFGEFGYLQESTSQYADPNSVSSYIQRYTKNEKITGLSLSHSLFFPVYNWFSVNVVGGALITQRKTNESTFSRSQYIPDVGDPIVYETQVHSIDKDTNFTATFGLGAMFYMGSHFGTKLGWERNFSTTSEKTEIDVISLDLRYIF